MTRHARPCSQDFFPNQCPPCRNVVSSCAAELWVICLLPSIVEETSSRCGKTKTRALPAAGMLAGFACQNGHLISAEGQSEALTGTHFSKLSHPNGCLGKSRLFQKSAWEMRRSLHFPGINEPCLMTCLEFWPEESGWERAWKEPGKEGGKERGKERGRHGERRRELLARTR